MGELRWRLPAADVTTRDRRLVTLVQALVRSNSEEFAQNLDAERAIPADTQSG